MALKLLQLLVIIMLGADLMTFNQVEEDIVRLSMATKYTSMATKYTTKYTRQSILNAYSFKSVHPIK